MTKRITLTIMFVAICLAGCQKETLNFPKMNGAWTELGTGVLREVKHVDSVPGTHHLIVGGIPEEIDVGLRILDGTNQQWMEPSDNLPVNHIVPNILIRGGDIYAAVFSNASEPGKILISHDGGLSWPDECTLPQDADPRCLTVSGSDGNRLLIGTVKSGIYLSDDSGVTWQAPETLTDNPRIQCLAVDSSNHDHIFAGTIEGLCESNDNGTNWLPITNRFTREPVLVVDISAHPNKGGCFVMITRDRAGKAAVIISDDSGQTWTPIIQGLYEDTQPRCVTFHPEKSETLFLGSVYDGIYKSDDLGQQWYPINNGLPLEKLIIMHDLTFLPDKPLTLIAGSSINGQIFQLVNP